MENKKECKIIQDLLPNYIENLTSEETNSFIEEHLNYCNDCREKLEIMKKNLNFDTEKRDDREVKYIKKFNSKLQFLKITIVIILIVALIFMTYSFINMKNAYVRAAEQLYSIVSEGRYPDSFYAVIEEIIDPGVYGLRTIKIKNLDTNHEKHIDEYYYFDIPLNNIPDNFKIKLNGNDISFNELKEGQKVLIYNYGEIDENYLTEVRMIIVLDEEL